jgi:Predicted membrane protein involved in D-alanine export
MIFNSIQYLIFFAFAVLITASLAKRRRQLAFLLFASYLFYFFLGGYYIISLFFVSCITFYCGEAIYRASDPNRKKFYLFLALLGTLGQLALFKYPEIPIGIFKQIFLANSLGVPQDSNFLLPIGISFYTFQSLSYVFDIYRNRLKPASSVLDYCLFVAFFPQITSGPIIRAKNFLTQLNDKAHLEITSQNLKYGITLIGIGLAKKMVLADNIAPYADSVFSHPTYYNSLRIILATLAFGIQLYCDFSGYSDMAIGSARILGFIYPANFNNPYLSVNPSDFWRRWHISLSSFLRDYLYISLGGNRKGPIRNHANIMITMALCGLWHGGTWNFLIWGIYHGCLLSAHRLFAGSFLSERMAGLTTRRAWLPVQVLTTQYFVFLGWLIFRVENLDDLTYCVEKFIFWDFLARIHYGELVYGFLKETSVIISIFILYIIFIIVYRNRFCETDCIGYLSSMKLRYWLIYLIVIILMITWFSPGTESNFIYSAF